MNHGKVRSFDDSSIYFETSGTGDTALVFVHGWLGNTQWWNLQKERFAQDYQIIKLDLAGHGKSDRTRKDWSILGYAKDVEAVVNHLGLKSMVLIGHSMSGCVVVEANRLLPERIKMLVFVDTLLNLDEMPTLQQAAPFLEGLAQDYEGTLRAMIPPFMFAETSPPAVVQRIVDECVAADQETAVPSLKPYYTTDMRDACREVKIPVRAINADKYPTSPEVNRKYFSDFDFSIIPGVGHYPMLEAPQEFNDKLAAFLKSKS